MDSATHSDSPVIILGVHRSGTSLLTRMLEQLGLFVGNDLQGDHESLCFISINNAFFEKKGASWDKPIYPAKADIADNMIRRIWNKQANVIAQQFGPATGFWGFKDPRAVTTLPLWLDLFPDAKVIYIKRGPWPIAKSLSTRHQKMVEEGVFPPEGDFYKGRIKFSQRCKTLEGALDFAVEQIRYIEKLERAGLLKGHLTLSYNDLLADPLYEASRILNYLGRPTSKKALTAAVALPKETEERPDLAIALKAYYRP